MAERSSARLLASLLLVIVVLGTSSGLIQLALVEDFAPTFWRMSGALVVLAIAYVLARTPRWRLAAWAAALVPIAATALVGMVHPEDRGWFAFMLVGVLVAATFLTLRATSIVAVFAFGAVLLVVAVTPGLQRADRFVPAITLHAVVSPLLLLATSHRERIARAREEALRASEQRYTRLVEDAPDAILTIDSRGVLLDGNPATARIAGRPLEALIGKRWDELGLVEPQTIAALATRIAAALDGKAPALLATKLTRPDGTEVWIESIGSVVARPDGPIIQVLLRDISERVRAEAERLELVQQLEQARRLEAIGQLAGGVAHDFNNLLTVILMNVEEIRGRHADPELEDIQSASQRAAALTSNLLAFARRVPGKPEVIDLNDVLASLERILEKLVGASIQLVIRLDARPSTIEADPIHLEQVIINLVANARDAVIRGGRIELGTRRLEDLPETVELYVRDNGPGMSEDTAARIFEPFFTTKPHGTGIGLATVRALVKQNHGQIVVESSPSQGALFRVRFPVAVVSPAPTHAPAVIEPRGAKQVVLLVEDDAAVRRATTRMLTSNGFVVLAAGTPHEALELAEQHRDALDMIVTDVVMPELGGHDLIDRIGRDELPVVYMSGYAATAMADHGIDIATAQIVQKPFTQTQLLGAIENALVKGALTASARSRMRERPPTEPSRG